MNGIGMIIPGADFSNSPLGTVTILKSNLEIANEIVDAYKTATSVTDTSALLNFVYGLLDAELWDSIDAFFPMLGNSLDAKLADVKVSSRKAWQGANFQTNEKGIYIANNIDAGTPSSDLWYIDTPFIGATVFAAASIADNETVNTHPLLINTTFKDAEDGSVILTRDTNTLRTSFGCGDFGGLRQVCYGNASENDILAEVSYLTPHRYVGYNSDSKRYFIVDGTLKQGTNKTMTDRDNFKQYPVFGVNAGSSINGGQSIERKASGSTTGNTYAGQRALDGIMYAAGFGTFDTVEEVQAADALFGTFLRESGKIQ